MNTLKYREKFDNFRILLDIGCSFTIAMGRLITTLNPKEDNVMQCHNQVGSITTNIKVKIEFTLPEISRTKTVTWNCNVDDSVKESYDMILGRDI